MTERETAEAIEENVDLFIGQYGKVANDFGIAKGFLSAAVGHAAVTMDDRAPLRDLLLAAANAAEKGKEASARHSRPVPWTPTGGGAEVTQIAVGKIAATLGNLHASDRAGDRAVLNAAALRAGLIMICWHDPKLSAAAIRAFAGALKGLPTGGLQ